MVKCSQLFYFNKQDTKNKYKYVRWVGSWMHFTSWTGYTKCVFLNLKAIINISFTKKLFLA